MSIFANFSAALLFLTFFSAVCGFNFHIGEWYPPSPENRPPPPPANDGSMRDTFQCPSSGRYALKQPKKANCGQYYECTYPGFPPSAIMICPGDTKFNRLSRTCLEPKYVYCKWCTKEGRHEDITSTKHFIECLPGSVAVRLRCRAGNYDPKKRECKEKAWKIFDITVDSEVDMPEDIIKFQTDWKEAMDLEDGGDNSIEKFEEDENKDQTKTKDASEKKKKKGNTEPGKKKKKSKDQDPDDYD